MLHAVQDCAELLASKLASMATALGDAVQQNSV